MKVPANFRNKLRTILLHPWLLALVVTLLLIPLLPPVFNKYSMELAGQEKVTTGLEPLIYYIDLDSDGYSEKIISYQNHQENHSIQIFDHMGGIIDQWNFRGRLPGSRERYTTGDYDNDSLVEIYLFTIANDSLFLHAFEPLDNDVPITFRNRFVIDISSKYAEPDISVIDPTLVDLDNDNRKELYFAVAGGYSKFPRRLFIYDIRDKIFKVTPDCGSVAGNVNFIDLDGNGRMEIIGGTGACGNIPDSLDVPYSDYSAWFMIFNSELEHYIDPVEFEGFGSRLCVRPYMHKQSTLIALLYNHVGASDNYPLVRLYGNDGNVLREKRFPLSDKSNRALFTRPGMEGNDRLFLIEERGIIVELDAQLDTIGEFTLGKEITLDFNQFDMDGDGAEEYLFTVKNAPQYLLTTQDFSDPLILEHDAGQSAVSFGLIINGKDPRLFYLQLGETMNFYRYGKNPLYYYRYLFYLGIFAGVLLFIYLIRKIQLLQIQRQEKVKAQIMDLQLRNIRAQMDPHFTFNMFNTVASMIRKEDKENAYRFFLKFSNLIRSSLVASSKITRSLQEELEHVRNYIELEKERYSDRFDFEVNIVDGMNLDMQVPKMVLQIFIENALKHGILNMEERGRIILNVHKNAKALVLEVEDNGVGREKAAQFENGSTGMGLKIMEDYFSLFNQRSDSKLSYRITDLYNEERKPRGTRVEIIIPLGFDFGENTRS